MPHRSSIAWPSSQVSSTARSSRRSPNMPARSRPTTAARSTWSRRPSPGSATSSSLPRRARRPRPHTGSRAARRVRWRRAAGPMSSPADARAR
jgi:hypothetical protein